MNPVYTGMLKTIEHNVVPMSGLVWCRKFSPWRRKKKQKRRRPGVVPQVYSLKAEEEAEARKHTVFKEAVAR